MSFDLIAPTILGQHAPVEPAICRVSPDNTRLAFWVPEANPPGLFVGEIANADQIGIFSKRIFSPADGHIADVAWSGDGHWLGFTLTAGPPPGEVRIVAVRLIDQKAIELPGISFAWAGNAATLLIADHTSSRLYLKDLELDIEHRLAEIADDGDPHFPPVISVSIDQRRFALVTRRVKDDITSVHLAHHDGRQWETRPLTDVPGTSLRVLPFWSFDSQSLALYVIDLERRHTSVVALPGRDGPGNVLYASETIDGFVTPAPHPDGRLIAMIRAQAAADNSTENRLVLIDPVERSAAAIGDQSGIVQHLRWLDDRTLLVEADRAVWNVKLEATIEHEEPPPVAVISSETITEPPASEPPLAREGFTRTVVRDAEARFTFVCELPADWKYMELPTEPVDFNDPRVMRPLCIFAPVDAPLIFTVATRPIMPGATAAALGFLSRVQGFEIEEITEIDLPSGRAAQTFGKQISGKDVMKMRLIMIEDGGHFFSIVVMAPDLIWEAVAPLFDHMIQTFELVDPRGRTTPSMD